MNDPKPTRVIPCPRCRKSTWFDASNAFRPFCSALCKNEDIISWAEEGYRIPVAANEDDLETHRQPEPDDGDE